MHNPLRSTLSYHITLTIWYNNSWPATNTETSLTLTHNHLKNNFSWENHPKLIQNILTHLLIHAIIILLNSLSNSLTHSLSRSLTHKYAFTLTLTLTQSVIYLLSFTYSQDINLTSSLLWATVLFLMAYVIPPLLKFLSGLLLLFQQHT